MARLSHRGSGDLTTGRRAARLSPLVVAVLALPSAGPPVSAPAATTSQDPVVAARSSAPPPRGPTRTLHVSPGGRMTAAGTRAEPLGTIGSAIRRARPGEGIVVHGGAYPEELRLPRGKPLRIRAAAGERVWLDGSRVLHRWGRTPHGYVRRWWREFDSSPTYIEGAPDHTEDGWAFIDPTRPMAAHPDQVWIDGVPQQQVGSLGQLRKGTFFVDDALNELHIGSSPRGREVRAAVLSRAISVQAAGTRITGINVRRYAPAVPQMGAVTVEAGRVTLRDMVIRESSTTGLHVMAAHVRLRGVTTARNGMLGMSGTYADGLRITRLTSRRNNTEGFNTSPVAGGVKIGRSRRVIVRRSRFVSNAGTGLWLDESSSDIRILDSTMRDNARHGLSLEISARALVADTLVQGNRGFGIKVNNTQDVALWNNTLVGNGRALNLVQDDRAPHSPDAVGRDPRQPFPDPTMTWRLGPVSVHNNILGRSRRSAECLLCVEDYSGRFSAESMGVVPSGNVYQRSDATRPSWIVVWSRGAGDPAVFHNLVAFRLATGHESRHLELIGRAAVTASSAATPRVTRAVPHVAFPLPGHVASLLNRRPGSLHLGAWLEAPPRG